jgi:hypothetical protein
VGWRRVVEGLKEGGGGGLKEWGKAGRQEGRKKLALLVCACGAILLLAISISVSKDGNS